jgi:hypothetical protein
MQFVFHANFYKQSENKTHGVIYSILHEYITNHFNYKAEDLSTILGKLVTLWPLTISYKIM